MRKRRETQKGSLSSAQATGDNNVSQENNVAEQGEELMNAVGNLLHGKRIDEVISVGISIALDGVRQKLHGNPLIAMRLFKQVVENMDGAFRDITLKQCIDE